MIGIALVLFIGLSAASMLMIFHIGPFWIKPIIILASIIVAAIVAMSQGKVESEEGEKKQGGAKKKEEPPKEEKPKEEPLKEEKKKEESKKTTDAKKHPWQQESKGSGFGALVMAIILLAGAFYLVSGRSGPAFLQKPEYEPPVQTVYSGGETVSPKEETSKPSLFKEEVINVKYTPGQQEVKISTLVPGEYKISVTDSDFTYQRITPDGNVIDAWLVGPEGMVGRKFNNQSEFPMPAADPVARLIRIGNGPWQFLGAGTTIHIEKESDVFVTINVRRNPLDFCNTGGDVIKVKRSGQ